jgi:hypothetical protein
MRPRSMSGSVPLQRISSFETLANGFSGNLSAKAGTIHEAIKPRSGYRRESIATQAAQHVLDEVFRSSIRGNRNGNGQFYGAVRPATIRPRTADWIQEIPTPVVQQRSSLAPTHAGPPLISMASDINSAVNRGIDAMPSRRKISLASTVFESDEESLKSNSKNGPRAPEKRIAEEDDGDDEYDEANAVPEDDATDHETNSSLQPLYPPRHTRSGRIGTNRPSPVRRHSSKPYKIRRSGHRGSGSERDTKTRSGRRRHGEKTLENQDDRFERKAVAEGDGVSETVAFGHPDDLVEKLRTLERLVADITQCLHIDKTDNGKARS